MIHESRYWKDDLLKQAEALNRRRTQIRWPEPSLARVEQSLMLGFYSIRKLHEAAKLSNATMTRPVSLISYGWLGKHVTRLNWHKLDRLYDFTSPQNETRDVLLVCHQFVHSYVFSCSFNEDNTLEGILFASDHQRHVSLLHISIVNLVELFENVGNDYPSYAAYKFNAKTRDYEVFQS